MKVDGELLQIFREESEERVDRLVQSLLSVEAGRADPGVIDSLFRDAHSIKGNAGMVGFDEVRAIAHVMEDLLDQARSDGELGQELIEPLLGAADAIRRGVGGETGVADEVVQRLRGVPTGGNGASSGGASNGAAAANGSPAPAEHRERKSMRVAPEKVDHLLDVVGETVLHHQRLEHFVDNAAGAEEGVDEELRRGEVLLDDLQDSVLRMRALPLSSITGPFPRAVRDLAVQEGKELELAISGDETQLDRVILDGISETITHLLRNAVSHGIELPDEREQGGKARRGRIELRAEQRHGMVAIQISDDGRGVPAELLDRVDDGGSLTDVLASAGFSTAAEVTEISGRGVGLDAVKSHVESLGGSLEIVSTPGAGTRSEVLLPLTLALVRVLLVGRGGQSFAIPLASVQEAVAVTKRTSLAGRTAMELRGTSVVAIDLAELIGLAAPELRDNPPAVIVVSSAHRAAVMCDELLGDQEAVIKSLGLLAGVGGYLGGTILGDGRIAMVLDPAYLARAQVRGRIDVEPSSAARRAARILVVDDQFTVRELQRSILEAAGREVAVARDGQEALEAIKRDADIALVVTDIEMPRMDGFALLEAIRADSSRHSLPVVVVTSAASDEYRRRGAELGADAYIVKKDFDQRTLLDTVRRLLGD